ncbi:MAG: hypothetical protein ACRYFA_13570 [Janthinobacterium lividum]
MFSKPAVAGITFFLLEQKEPKIQECRIASGRHSSHYTRVATVIVLIFLMLIVTAFIFYFPFNNFLVDLDKAACKTCAQERGAEQTPGGDRLFLISLVLFDQAKRTKARAECPLT